MSKPAGEFRQILRRLLGAPRFTIVAVLTLAAAVGATGAVFGVLNGVLLRPLPYRDADRLVRLWHTAPGVNVAQLNLAPSQYFIYREQSTAFDEIGLYQQGLANVTGSAEPEQVPVLRVTEGTFTMIGAAPAQGRLFNADDMDPGAPATAVLGHAYWLRKFGGDAAVVGRQVPVDGSNRTIIGILPRGFRFLDEPDAAVVMPLRFNRSQLRLGQFNYRAIGRLKTGATLADATADFKRMLPIVFRSFPAPDGFGLKMFDDAGIAPTPVLLKDDIIGDVGGVLRVVMAGIAVVLLIACANVSNLWLIRLEGRQHDLALRAALGAGRWRLARELLTECLIIGMAAGAIGLGLAVLCVRGLVALAPAGLPRVRDISVDWTVALATLAMAIGASLLFGALPIVKHARARMVAGLRAGARGLSQTREQTRLRGALVVVQVALALVLMVSSGLMIRTFVAMTNVNPGFVDGASLQTFRIFVPSADAPDAAQLIAVQRDMLNRLAAIPGVSSVAVSSAVPMDGGNNADPVFVQDRVYRDGEVPKVRNFKFLLPGSFATMGTPIVAGRDFTWAEVDRHAAVALVSRDFAVEYWKTPDQALGKRIRVASNDDWREVIGVVGDVYDDGVSRPPTSTVYWPIVQERFEGDALNMQRGIAFAVRTPRAGTEALLKDMQQAVWTVKPNLPLFSVNTVDVFYRRSMARTTFTLIVLGAVGSMALLLAVIGLYGVVAYSVSQRTREIGVRLALGAEPGTLATMFVRDGLRLAVVGVVVGLAGAFALVRLMSSLLFGVSAIDPITYVVVSAALFLTALGATYVPSRRAASVDPAIVLRGE